MYLTRLVLILAVAQLAAIAQDQPPPPRPARSFIRTTGEAVVNTKPDQARIDIGVTTQGPTAQAAAAQNARQLDAVVNEIKKAFGNAAELKTIGYSVNPDYRYPKQGGEPTIAGYTANNILQIKMSDLAQVGKLIDLATQSGANRVQGVQFSLKDESAVQSEALREAAVKARTKADALASASGVKILRVMSLEEGGANIIRPMMAMAMEARAQGPAPPTPVESGTIEVRANVTLMVEIGQ
jgi:uncharacterized protein YggE